MIKIRGLKKSFGNRSVLNGLDLDVGEGETLVVIGRSGCGKSLLLKHILGLVQPDAGDVWVDGVRMSGMSDADAAKTMRLKFGMLFQNAALFDSLTVGENVGFGLAEHTRLSSEEMRQRVTECLTLVDLDGWAEADPSELSGGMRKRVGLARAMAMRPEILLVDEPTTGLDPITADAINDLMVKLKDSLRVTSVVVTHDLKSAYRVASWIAFLHDGRIHYSGRPEDLDKTEDPVVKEFISV